MILQQGTEAFERFLTDHLGEGYEPWEREVFMSDEAITCLTCGSQFTCETDFDEDEYRRHGERICLECSAEENYDPIQRRWR